MATCDTPGMVTITHNVRMCRHLSMAVARGVAIVNPDELFLIKSCNLGNDQVNVRKNSALGFAEPNPRTYVVGRLGRRSLER